MLKQKIKKINIPRITAVFGVLGVSLVLVAFGSHATSLLSDSYDSQIETLQTQNDQDQSSLSQLQLQASSYQDAISQLQQQISGIQAAIVSSQNEIDSLQTQITQDQAEITYQKQVLGEDIRVMYVQGQTTTLEVLASSNNLNEFVSKEVDHTAVQDKVKSELSTIIQIQQQLQQQQQQEQNLETSQQTQENQLASDQQQQSQLLGYNQGQQDAFNQQIASNNSEISALRAQQAAANASVASSVDIQASGGSGGACDIGYGNGGYPMSLCNAPQDSITDPWGFPNRECTSFANWYFVTQEGQSNFKVSGNAGAWWETSNYPAITWGSDVQVGALGIEPGTVSSNGSGAPVPSLHGSYYGHVMVVVALPGQTYQGYTVPSNDVLVMSMNEDEEGHFMYDSWPVDDLMFINPQ